MPRNRELREVNDDEEISEENLGTNQTSRSVALKILLYPGFLMSLLGFGGGSMGFLPSLSFFNRFLHLGKWKWVLHSGLFLLGFLGISCIYCAYPGARKRIKTLCCGKCIKRKKQYDRLVEDMEEGQVAT